MVEIALSEMKAKCQTANRARCTVGPDLDTNRLQNWKEYQQTTAYKTYYNFLLLLNSAIMNKLYHTEKIYLLVPLFHVSFRERLTPGDAFLSPNAKFASKGFQSCPGKIVFLAVQNCGTPRNKPTTTCHHRSACLKKLPNKKINVNFYLKK